MRQRDHRLPHVNRKRHRVGPLRRASPEEPACREAGQGCCSEHDTGTNRLCLRYKGAGAPERMARKRTGKRGLYQKRNCRLASRENRQVMPRWACSGTCPDRRKSDEVASAAAVLSAGVCNRRASNSGRDSRGDLVQRKRLPRAQKSSGAPETQEYGPTWSRRPNQRMQLCRGHSTQLLNRRRFLTWHRSGCRAISGLHSLPGDAHQAVSLPKLAPGARRQIVGSSPLA